ncbi:MAG TPA: HAD family hydrolase [Anaeromyxobacter sp.]|jgi:HAD superfamily hydrolase (TIGR01509 family)|nr:HAD family hydrolase [Anaeromyxobacter sp.]
MGQRVAAVLFDVDGTLVESIDLRARAWADALRRSGKDVRVEDVRAQIGKGGDQLLPVFLSEAELRERGNAIDRLRSELWKREYMPRVRPLPCARELVARVRREGKRVALASGENADEVRFYERLLGVEGLVEGSVTSDDAGRSEPRPDVFGAALARARTDAEDAVAVGDSPWDALAARRAGVRTVGVLSGGFPEGDLRDAGCIAVYRDPADLLARFDLSPLAA